MKIEERIDQLRLQLQRTFDEMVTLVVEGGSDFEKRGVAESFDSLMKQINTLKKRRDRDARRS